MERDGMPGMSEYDRRIREAMVALGGAASAARIAQQMCRPTRGMDASLRAATARVDWLEKAGGVWCLTPEALGPYQRTRAPTAKAEALD